MLIIAEDKAVAVREAHLYHTALQLRVVKNITDQQDYITAIEKAEKPDQPLTAILHLAAPFSYSVTDFEKDLLQPAVRGTEAILNVAQHFQVTRVLHTNSFASIYDAAAGAAPEKTYTSADWSPLTYEDGVEAPNAPAAYRAAKTVAEKTAWDWIEKNVGSISFGLVSLCPAMVFGPFLPRAEPASLKVLNESNKIVWDVVSQGEAGSVPPTKAPIWVDARDVAAAHVKALTIDEVVGQRLLLAAGAYCNQEITDVARETCSRNARIPVGEPGKREAHTHFGIDTTQEIEMLGVQWIKLEDSIKDIVPQLFAIEKRGADVCG